MKANELRVGNCILIDGQEFGIISEIRSNHAKVIYKGEVNGNISTRFSLIEFIRLAPIPLTDEWLVRFGFEKISKNQELIFNKVRICETVHKGLCWVDNDIDFIQIKHVHQLQNLYFALTGEELKLTDK